MNTTLTSVGTNQSRFIAVLVIAGGVAWQASELLGEIQYGQQKTWIERAKMTLWGAGIYWCLFMAIIMSDVGVE